jgi:hypothetical protein
MTRLANVRRTGVLGRPVGNTEVGRGGERKFGVGGNTPFTSGNVYSRDNQTTGKRGNDFMIVRLRPVMRHGDKVGIGALAIFLLGAVLLGAMLIWVDSPIQHLETLAFCLLWGGFLTSFYAAIRGSRWWLLLPASVICIWLLLANSKYAG